MRAFVSCDGEHNKQIEVFQQEDVLALFKDTLIDFGKTLLHAARYASLLMPVLSSRQRRGSFEALSN